MEKCIFIVSVTALLLGSTNTFGFEPDEITFIRMTYYPAFKPGIVIEVNRREQSSEEWALVLISNTSEGDYPKPSRATRLIDNSLVTQISKFVTNPEKAMKFGKPNRLIHLDGSGVTLEVGKNNYSVLYNATNIFHAGTEPADSEFTDIVRTLLELGEVDVH